MSSTADKPKIFVVDDEPDVILSLKRGLEYKGFIVDAYADPLIALNSYKASKYVLCLLDIRMPKMNGFQLYHEIRKLDANVKICFFTAFELNYREEFHKAFPELDERYFIPKPTTLTQLAARIELELQESKPVIGKLG